jgi:hypothetical protein
MFIKENLPSLCVPLLLPMVVFESRPPVGRPQQGLKGTGEIDESVEHQKEHGEQWSQNINVAQ